MILLHPVAGPLPHLDPCGMGTRPLDRIVGAVRVDDDDFVGPGDRLERLDDVGTFVVGDDRDGQLRHTSIVIANP